MTKNHTMDSRLRGKDNESEVTTIDRTAKNYIGGKQKRPDGNYSLAVHGPTGKLLGEVGEGNRKDIRDAVEAAVSASASWGNASGHNRAQIIYFMAENLSARESEFAKRLQDMTGCTPGAAKKEVRQSLDRLFTYAAWADKFDGAVHTPPMRGVTLAMNEPMGVVSIVCPDEHPLLSFISLLAPAMAMGNATVIVPSSLYPLAATDFYQILETSDVPGGVINIVTGDRDTLTKTLAEHDAVDSLWYFGTLEGSAFVEAASITNLKQTWVSNGKHRDWSISEQAEGREFLRRATQVKNIWVPYGETSGGGGGY